MRNFYLIPAILCVLWLTIAHASAERSLSAVDKCAAFDEWIGGERFDYKVDAFGNWNLPVDADLVATMTFPNSGIWKYYSAQESASYVIVFLSFEPSQPAGQRAGQHDICVYKVNDGR